MRATTTATETRSTTIKVVAIKHFIQDSNNVINSLVNLATSYASLARSLFAFAVAMAPLAKYFAWIMLMRCEH